MPDDPNLEQAEEGQEENLTQSTRLRPSAPRPGRKLVLTPEVVAGKEAASTLLLNKQAWIKDNVSASYIAQALNYNPEIAAAVQNILDQHNIASISDLHPQVAYRLVARINLAYQNAAQQMQATQTNAFNPNDPNYIMNDPGNSLINQVNMAVQAAILESQNIEAAQSQEQVNLQYRLDEEEENLHEENLEHENLLTDENLETFELTEAEEEQIANERALRPEPGQKREEEKDVVEESIAGATGIILLQQAVSGVQRGGEFGKSLLVKALAGVSIAEGPAALNEQNFENTTRAAETLMNPLKMTLERF